MGLPDPRLTIQWAMGLGLQNSEYGNTSDNYGPQRTEDFPSGLSSLSLKGSKDLLVLTPLTSWLLQSPSNAKQEAH